MKECEKFEYLLFDLSNDLTIYRQLFSNEESIATLNSFNSLIFGNYQKCLVNSIFSNIARLLDPPATGSSTNSNLSLPYLVERLSLGENAKVISELEKIKSIFSSSGLKKYRNKVLSHNDAKTAILGQSLSINIDASELEDLVERIGNLYFTMKYYGGLEEADKALDPLVTLPFDKNGASFISKLKQCM